MGGSLGGIVAQCVAIQYTQRVLSLALISTSGTWSNSVISMLMHGQEVDVAQRQTITPLIYLKGASLIPALHFEQPFTNHPPPGVSASVGDCRKGFREPAMTSAALLPGCTGPSNAQPTPPQNVCTEGAEHDAEDGVSDDVRETLINEQVGLRKIVSQGSEQVRKYVRASMFAVRTTSTKSMCAGCGVQRAGLPARC